jgi:protease PrsW
LGFATLENVLYVLNAGENGFSTALGRAFTAVPAHAAFGVLMGAYVGLAKFVPEKRMIYSFIGVGLAIFFHGAYDFFLMQQVYEGMGALAIFTLVWGIIMSRKLIRMGQEASPFKNPENTPPVAEITENSDTNAETDAITIENKDFI